MLERNAPAPDFSLTDTEGNRVTLSALRGVCNVLLVFNRGFADAYCRQFLALLRRDLAHLQTRRTVVLVVAPERPEQVREYWNRGQMPLVGLADPDHAVASVYGQQVDLFRYGRLPAIVLIDNAGQVRYAHYAGSPADLPALPDLLSRLDDINAEAG